MSLEDTVDTIKQIVNRIESVDFFDHEESMADHIKPIKKELPDYVNKVETEDDPLHLYKTLISETKEHVQKQNVLVEKSLSRLEKLSNKKATIQARIDLLEKHLKPDTVQPNQNQVQKLQEKRNSIFAWKLFTGVSFDYASQKVSGYHFNKKNGKYATFDIAKEGDYSGRLWSVISKNAKADDA